MKQIDRFPRTPAPRSRRASMVLAFVLLGSGFLSAFAAGAPTAPGGGGGGGGGGPPSFSGGGSGDDETVGTLPAFDGGPTFDVLRAARLTRPSLYVQGTVDAVLSAAVVVRGDRRVLAQPMSNGELRLVFLGNAQVGFDRNAFHAASLRVGVAIPDGSRVLRSGAAWNGQAIGTFARTNELPIAQLEAAGLLDLAPVQAAVATAQGTTRIRAQATADLVTLTQLR